MASRRRTPGIRARRWARRRWPTSLWTRFLRHAPTQPDWADRDRFVLSAGHASMLLYSLLHLTGYGVSLEDLEVVPPVGQHHAGSPGIRADARASRRPPARSARASPTRSGWPSRSGGWPTSSTGRTARSSTTGRTSSASDGDLQEGIASEAASLAGHLRLGKLIVLYDDNHIQLDGPTAMAWSEDVPKRFDAYGWHTQRVDDGNDVAAIEAAIEAALADDRAEPHRRPDPHRLRQPEQAGQPEGARVAARAGRGPADEGGLRLGSGQVVLRPGRGPRATSARRSRPARSSSPSGRRASTRTATPIPPRRPSFRRRMTRGGAARRLGRRPQDVRDRHRGGDPERAARTPSRPWPRTCPSCSAAPPTCPSRT